MANITEKYQQAKDAGYSDAEIQAFMAGAMKTGGPGVDKPGLPDSRTMPTPKNFPGFGNPAAEYARRQEPVNRMLDGAARMTRPGADAKFGGAADIMRGAGEIALPLAAVPLAGAGSIGAGAAMLGRMALGAGGGYAGGQVARSLVPKDQPGLQDFAESAGATAGGLLAGGGSESPKLGAFLKGAAKAAPTAMVRSGPYGMGGVAMHAMGHNKSAFVADAIAAAAGLPTVIRGGMAEAAGKPWLGPVFSGIFGKNKPQPVDPSTAGTYGVRNFDVGPPLPTPTPANFSLQSGTAGRPSGLLATELSLTPAEIIARQEEALRNIEAFKARQAANQNPRPTPTPTPTPKPTAPSENMASRMAAQDAAGQERTGLLGDPSLEYKGKLPDRVFHGTNKDFKQFDTSRALDGERAKLGVFFSEDPEFAGNYAQVDYGHRPGTAPNIRPASIKHGRVLDLDAYDKMFGRWDGDNPSVNLTPEKLKGMGFDTATRLEKWSKGGPEQLDGRIHIVPDPSRIESPWPKSSGLMNDVVAEAEKRGAWNEAGGKFFENATDLKQNALIKFAAEKGKPMQRFSESEYNALVKEFNATKPLHPIDGAPWRLERAGANYKPGKKAGRDVETTLRHFNNMRLGKE